MLRRTGLGCLCLFCCLHIGLFGHISAVGWQATSGQWNQQPNPGIFSLVIIPELSNLNLGFNRFQPCFRREFDTVWWNTQIKVISTHVHQYRPVKTMIYPLKGPWILNTMPFLMWWQSSIPALTVTAPFGTHGKLSYYTVHFECSSFALLKCDLKGAK